MAPQDDDPRVNDAARAIGDSAERKARARSESRHGIWFGLGMFGLIGWAVAVPTLVGVALGVWLDKVMPAGFSWTVTLLFAGVVLGCWNAWFWLLKESRHD